MLVELPTRDEREPVVGDGEGGDETTAIDAAAEEVILERLQGIEGTTIVSEEVGILGDGPTRIVVDPIDGSLNAKRGIPFFSVSIAVADGSTMDDVFFGYVYDFGTGEEWVGRARQGRAAERRRPRADLAEGGDRDPLLRGDLDLERRREGGRDGRCRLPPADHGLARALALPPGGRPRRRGLLAEGRALGRHRRRAAARARARARDRPARGAAVRRRAARPRGPLALRCRRDAGGLRAPASPRSRREAGPDRLLGLELPALAQRRLLPAAAAAAALARALRAALRHGRGELDLLPAAARDRGRELGRARARRTSSSP